jgi:hypothetical protein
MSYYREEPRVAFYSRPIEVLDSTHVNDFTKNTYAWMRVERNKIWTMCSPNESEVWRGADIFDYDVYWDHLYEIGDFYVLPGEGEVTLVRKDQMLNSPQRVLSWSGKITILKPWRDIVYYSKKTKRYNTKQRLDSFLPRRETL